MLVAIYLTRKFCQTKTFHFFEIFYFILFTKCVLQINVHLELIFSNSQLFGQCQMDQICKQHHKIKRILERLHWMKSICNGIICTICCMDCIRWDHWSRVKTGQRARKKLKTIILLQNKIIHFNFIFFNEPCSAMDECEIHFGSTKPAACVIFYCAHYSMCVAHVRMRNSWNLHISHCCKIFIYRYIFLSLRFYGKKI